MQGRGAGTAGQVRAREYIVDRFKAAGLAPAFGSITGPGYLQNFEVSLGTQVREQMLAAADGEPLTPGDDFSTLGLSADGGFEGPAVFVGYGVVDQERGYDSFGGLGDDGLKGKVAVAMRYEPMDEQRQSRGVTDKAHSIGGWSQAALFTTKARRAAELGAAALLVVTPPSHQAGSKLLSAGGTSGGAAAIPVIHIHHRVFELMLATTPGENPAVLAGRLQRQADNAAAAVLPLVNVRGRVRLEHPKTESANIGGIVAGEGDLADEYVVVAAHYDHLGYGEVGSMVETRELHPGADDNASGVAGLIMLAERSAERAQRSRGGRRRSVLFLAFAGEERGLLGSAHFIKQLSEAGIDPSQLTAMLNMDMIGRLENNRLLVFGGGSGDRWKQLLEAANARPQLTLDLAGSAMGASDHQHFYLKEVPVLHFFTGVHGDYHRPSDTADKINAAGGALVVQLIDSLVDELADEPVRLVFTEDESIAGGATMFGAHAAGGGARLGILPDYASIDATDGCAVQAVIPNSPAKAAGLLDGDVLTHWNGQPIANVRELTAVLGGAEPGQQVTLTVRRGRSSVELDVTLGSR